MFSRSISSFPIGSSLLIRSSIEKSALNICKRCKMKRVERDSHNLTYIIIQVDEVDGLKL